MKISCITYSLALSLLVGCSAFQPQAENYHVENFIGADNTNATQEWRNARGIPDDAMIAIYPDGSYKFVRTVIRTIQLQPSPDIYVNTFVKCYLNMNGTYLAEPVTLQVPCNRDPSLRPGHRDRHERYHWRNRQL